MTTTKMPSLAVLRDLRREVLSVGRLHGAQHARDVLPDLDRDIYAETVAALGYDPLNRDPWAD